MVDEMINIKDEMKHVKIVEGQIWRKQGPYNWLKIERIVDPDYQNYDGGLPGVTITSYPPQLKGIQLRGGKQYFMSNSPTMSWQEQIKHNRYLLEDGWKRGDNANSL